MSLIPGDQEEATWELGKNVPGYQVANPSFKLWYLAWVTQQKAEEGDIMLRLAICKPDLILLPCKNINYDGQQKNESKKCMFCNL